MTHQPDPTSADTTNLASLRASVQRVIEKIRPGIQLDGGDVELVEVTLAGAVRIRFLGECIGCPSAPMTLRHGIERTLRLEVPLVTSVEAVS
jgi:Fe-S cluster biogenesis protein NfuA